MEEEVNVDESVTAEAKASNDIEIDPKEKNEIQKHIKRKWTLILKISTHLKRETNYIQLNGGKYTKL